MSRFADKEAHAWLLAQAGYLDQEGYEAAVAEINAPKAPRSAPVSSGRARVARAPRPKAAPAARRVPKRQQRGLAGFLAGAQAGARKPSRRRR